MQNQEPKSKPEDVEEPREEGLDEMACSPIWFILRWHCLGLLWSLLSLVGFIWLVVGVIQGRDGYDVAMTAAVIGMLVVRVENYLEGRRREVSEKIELANQPLKAWSIPEENAQGQTRPDGA